MAEFLELRCPAISPHYRTTISGAKEPVKTCGKLLKIFKEPSEFEEYFSCPVCRSHILFIKKRIGSCKAMFLPESVRIKSSNMPMLVIGEKGKKNGKTAIFS